MKPFEIKLPTITHVALTDLPRGAWDACMVEAGPGRWAHYASSYREAGNALVEAVAQSSYRRNTLGAPILFCYRQYIELSLKDVLATAGILLDEPQVIPAEHFLLRVWKNVRTLLSKIVQEGDNLWIERAETVISQIDALDPNSYCFRYPVDTKGNPTLPDSVVFDAVVVRGIIDELAILIDGAGALIDQYQGLKYEGY